MTISIRPDLLTRVLSLGGDPGAFINGAVEAALEGRRYLTHSQSAPTEPTAGRPAKRRGRVQVTVQLEHDLLAHLDAGVTITKWSRSDILNWLLENWVAAGGPSTIPKK